MKRSSVEKYEKRMKKGVVTRSIFKMIISVLACVAIELVAWLFWYYKTSIGVEHFMFWSGILTLTVYLAIISFMYEDCKKDWIKTKRSIKRLKNSITITEE